MPIATPLSFARMNRLIEKLLRSSDALANTTVLKPESQENKQKLARLKAKFEDLKTDAGTRHTNFRTGFNLEETDNHLPAYQRLVDFKKKLAIFHKFLYAKFYEHTIKEISRKLKRLTKTIKSPMFDRVRTMLLDLKEVIQNLSDEDIENLCSENNASSEASFLEQYNKTIITLKNAVAKKLREILAGTQKKPELKASITLYKELLALKEISPDLKIWGEEKNAERNHFINLGTVIHVLTKHLNEAKKSLIDGEKSKTKKFLLQAINKQCQKLQVFDQSSKPEDEQLFSDLNSLFAEIVSTGMPDNANEQHNENANIVRRALSLNSILEQQMLNKPHNQAIALACHKLIRKMIQSIKETFSTDDKSNPGEWAHWIETVYTLYYQLSGQKQPEVLTQPSSQPAISSPRSNGSSQSPVRIPNANFPSMPPPPTAPRNPQRRLLGAFNAQLASTTGFTHGPQITAAASTATAQAATVAASNGRHPAATRTQRSLFSEFEAARRTRTNRAATTRHRRTQGNTLPPATRPSRPSDTTASLFSTQHYAPIPQQPENPYYGGTPTQMISARILFGLPPTLGARTATDAGLRRPSSAPPDQRVPTTPEKNEQPEQTAPNSGPR